MKKKRCSGTGPFPNSHQVTKSKGTTTIFAARTLAVILLFYSLFFSSFHNVLSLFQLNVPCIYTLVSRFFPFSPPRLFRVRMCLRYFYRSARFSSVMLYYCYPHVYCSTIVHAHFLWCLLHIFSF